MNEVLDLVFFISVVVAGGYGLAYIMWEITTRFVDMTDGYEQDYIETKDGEKIPYDEDTQE